MSLEPIIFELTESAYTLPDFEEAFFQATRIRVRFSEHVHATVAKLVFDHAGRLHATKEFKCRLNYQSTLTDVREYLLHLIGVKWEQLNESGKTAARQMVTFYKPNGDVAAVFTKPRSLQNLDCTDNRLLIDTLAFYMGRRFGTINKSRRAVNALRKVDATGGLTDAFTLEALKWDRAAITAFYQEHNV